MEGHLEGANKAQERCWLEHSIKLIEKETLNEEDIIAWSAYHASLQHPSDNIQPALTQLLPLFHKQAATASMIKHGMDVLRKTIQFLNPAQIPVITLDAPLYALAKYVQWNWPQTHGEDKYVVMFGGRHVWRSSHQNGDVEHILRLLGSIRLDYCTDPGGYCIFWHGRLLPQSIPSHQDETCLATK